MSEYDDGIFSFRDRVKGDLIEMGNSHFGSYDVKIVPGNYDVYYEVQSDSSGVVPINPRVKIGTNVSASGGTFNVNVISHQLSGNFRHNGGAFPNTVQHTGKVLLRDNITGADSTLGLTSDGSYQRRVVEAVFKTVY